MGDELEGTAPGDTSQDRGWQQTLETVERRLREASQAVTLLRRQMEADAAGAHLDGAKARQEGAAPDADGAEAHQDGAALHADGPEARQDGAALHADGPEAHQDGAAPDADGPQAHQDGAALHVEDRKAPPAKDATDGDHAPPSPQQPAAAPGRPSGVSTFDRLWDRIERERTEKQEDSSSNALSGRRGLDRLPQHYLMTIEDREGKVDLPPLHRALAGLPGADEISLVSYSNGVPVVSLRIEGELDFDQLSDAVSTAMDRVCEVIPQDTGKLYLRMKARQD